MNFLQRFPFAILGAFGLVSLASGVINLEKHLADWVQVWQAVTYPVWEFLFGWFFAWVDWEFPWWVKDYLTIGTIISGMTIRALCHPNARFFSWLQRMYFFFMALFIWPYFLIFVIAGSIRDWSETDTIFWETAVYSLLIIAVSYTLIFSGISSPAAS